MIRAVVDVNVFLSALISPGGVADRLLRHTANRQFELVMSPRLVRTVMMRPRFRQYFTVEEAERLITDLWELALRVEDAEEVPAVTRDPDDDYLVALTRSAAADVLVSGDRDLLALQADVEVISPREFVDHVDEGRVSDSR